MMPPEITPWHFPHAKRLDRKRFAYIVPLTFGRARINVAPFKFIWDVTDFY